MLEVFLMLSLNVNCYLCGKFHLFWFVILIPFLGSNRTSQICTVRSHRSNLFAIELWEYDHLPTYFLGKKKDFALYLV